MNRNISNDERTAEGLSSLADGEIPAHDLSDWIEALARDEASRQQFARYRLIGVHLAEDTTRIDASRVADGVRSALQDEPAILAPRRHRNLSLPLPRLALGTALAAGVAAMAIGLAPQMLLMNQSTDALEAPTFAFAPRLSVPADGITTVALGAQRQSRPHQSGIQPGQRWKVLSPAVQQKISRYLLEHNELAGQIAAQRPSAHLGYISTHDAQ